MSDTCELYSAIVQNLSDGVFVIQDNRAVYLNDRFAEVFGYDCIQGMIGEDMFTTVYCDRQSVDFFRKIHDQILAGNPEHISWGQHSARCDGTPFWIEVDARRIMLGGRPAVFGAVNDRTDCKRIGEAMHASQETLRLMLDAMEDRVYVVTDDYRLVYANKKMLANMTGDIGQDFCYQLCRGLNTVCEDCSVNEVFRTGGPMYKEFYNEKAGRWFWVIELAIRMPGMDRMTKLAVARDITSRKEKEKKIRALSHRLLTTQENERKYLSRELHDDLGQRLNAVKIAVDTLAEEVPEKSVKLRNKVHELSEIIHDSIRSVHEIATGLRPLGLERLGLVGTIRNGCNDIAKQHPIKIDFHAAGMKNVTLDQVAQINLYRIFQEATNNILKHARATEIKVRLVASYPVVRLMIEDNGCGFDPSRPRQSDREHLGLVGMAERVDLLNGTFRVVSQIGEGTRVTVEIPVVEQLPPPGSESVVPRKKRRVSLACVPLALQGALEMCEWLEAFQPVFLS